MQGDRLLSVEVKLALATTDLPRYMGTLFMKAALSRLGKFWFFLLAASCSISLEGEMGTILERALYEPSTGERSGVDLSETTLWRNV